MNLPDVLAVLRRRWVTFVLALLAVIGASIGALELQTPVYQASATLSLTPVTTAANPALALEILPQIGVLTPAYAEEITAADTRVIARAQLATQPGNYALTDAKVSTFPNAPTILKLSTNSTSPLDAQLSAAAYVTALNTRVKAGQLGGNILIKVDEIESPVLPTAPVSPRKTVTIGAGVLLGLIVAFIAAWVRDQTGGTIEDAEALRHAAGIQVFGEIPESRRVPRIHSVDALLTDDRLRPVAEAMRDLGVALQLTQFDADSVLVTSPGVANGKTTVAFGLAVALARSGVETLLVDGDLRRGRLEELLSEEPTGVRKSPGLMDVLRGLPFEDAVQGTTLANLHVLTSGELVEDPSVLLDSAFPAVLREMERRYAVVLDATPLMPINDSRVMAKFCSTTLLVASSGSASRRDIKRALDRLKIIGVTPTATVLNRARVRDSVGYGSPYLRARSARETVRGASS
ncbi:MAG TPA: hypothetical protein VNG13_12880 [Mycobacteriales bacterium]|nr:hypothetical protein [Mycobacteriales bacterium]